MMDESEKIQTSGPFFINAQSIPEDVIAQG